MADYLMMDALTAAMLRGATHGDDARLDPRLTIDGHHALPLAVREDPAFGWLGDVLGELTVQPLGLEAWPVADA